MFRSVASSLAHRVLYTSKTIGCRSSITVPGHLRYATTLVIADPNSNGSTDISTSTCQAVTAANQLGNDQLTILIVGGTTLPTQIPQGTTKVVHVPIDNNINAIVPETFASAIVAAVQADTDITHVVGTSTKFGSTIVPRAAALLSSSSSDTTTTTGTYISPLHDVIQIISNDTFVRPMYAGNVLVKVQMKDTLKILSIRPTAFDKTPLIDTASVQLKTEQLTNVEPYTGSVYVGASNSNNDTVDRPDLSTADIVVTGGRGMGHKDQFQLLEELANAFGTNTVAIGASRAAVDAGMAPNDQQVGQTGKVVAPNLYIAVGVSGAIQHLSGMKDSKTIVAINKDPDAPIFQVADYGLVADLFQAVPELTTKLKAFKASSSSGAGN